MEDRQKYKRNGRDRRKYKRIENAEEVQRQKEIRELEIRESEEEIYHIR